MSQRTVLNGPDIDRALKRIAHEILEANEGPDNLVLLGIPTRGVHLAKRISELLQDIDPNYVAAVGALDITMYRDDMASAQRQIQETLLPASGIADKVVVLVDDVLYSGRTVRAALDALIDFGRPSQVKLAVLVDRGHRELPIRPDFVGKNLPTSKTERVTVQLVETDSVDQVVIGE
jgi:pyrimidine operon attenuation protein / uracil phosphoribosyltransferase